jgi:hypothetical protein
MAIKREITGGNALHFGWILTPSDTDSHYIGAQYRLL